MTTPPTLDDPAQIRAIAKRFADQTTPLTRQRVNVLSAAASVVTQLPADELATFVRSSAHLSTRLLELTATLDAAERALLDYAEALERRQTISEEPDYLDETMPRSLDTGSSLVHPRALPTHSISEHLVGAKADEGTVTGRSATEAVEHELDFLTVGCIHNATVTLTNSPAASSADRAVAGSAWPGRSRCSTVSYPWRSTHRRCPGSAADRPSPQRRRRR